MNYKALVRSHLEPLLASGISREVVADKLGVKPNYLTMILRDRYPNATLPLQRIPRLCSLCGLSGTESVRLVRYLSTSGARQGAHFDYEIFEWLMRSTDRWLKEQRA